MHVKTLCLGALSIADSTGYDIKKLFEAAFNHFQSASYGSIYPSLRKLEEEGAVTCHVEPGDKHPDRKCFQLTERGRERLLSELSETPATELVRSDFLALLFFAHLLPTGVLQQKLDEIEAHYDRELTYLESICQETGLSAGMRFGIEQGIAVYKAKLQHLRKHREELLITHTAPAGQTQV